MHAVSLKVPSFYSEVYEEPLMFCLNEEDEEDEPSQSDSGKIFFQSNFSCGFNCRVCGTSTFVQTGIDHCCFRCCYVHRKLSK